MKYTKTQFLKDVAAEAKALKKNATKEELAGLSFTLLIPDERERCIYGLMTGECRSNRAIELIEKCCIKSVENLVGYEKGEKVKMEEVAAKVNGTAISIEDKYKYLSAIETYIITDFAKPKNLIAYLRGERKDLVL